MHYVFSAISLALINISTIFYLICTIFNQEEEQDPFTFSPKNDWISVILTILSTFYCILTAVRLNGYRKKVFA